jgi:hypothetical protein
MGDDIDRADTRGVNLSRASVLSLSLFFPSHSVLLFFSVIHPPVARFLSIISQLSLSLSVSLFPMRVRTLSIFRKNSSLVRVAISNAEPLDFFTAESRRWYFSVAGALRNAGRDWQFRILREYRK